MTQSELLQKLFPDLLENAAQEVGDLIGETLALKDPKSAQGRLQEVFTPPRKKFGLADFGVKGREQGQAHLCFDLDLAVELAGRLIMLPEDEIKAGKKQGKLEGELLDAFSEIANIISGVMNSVCHDALPKHKLHFVKGKLEVYAPKTGDLPLPDGALSCFSASLSLGETSLGAVHFLLPHSLIQEAQPEAEQGTAAAADDFEATPAPVSKPETASEPEADRERTVAGGASEQPSPEQAPESETASADLNQEQLEEILLEGLKVTQEELGGLLGASVEFEEQKVRHTKKQELLAKTKGKQVLTGIAVSGDREGEAFMLLPLRDAVFFAGLLLMMPEETITQTVKQGKFEGEVTDAFDEIANILVGCFSNHFKKAFPLKLGLKKLQATPMVPSQVDLNTEQPFASRNYIQLSAKIQLEGKYYGPLEFLFPGSVLGLKEISDEAGVKAAPEPARQSVEPARSQKTDSSQKTDTPPKSPQSEVQGRVISIIGEDSDQCRMVEESIDTEEIDLIKLSLDGDFKEPLAKDNLCCVFLLMNKVNDQGLAKAIKVRSSLKKECPLIVAGPQWTKSMVFKALKYGATDILITPADRELIQKKFRKYL